MPLNIFTTKQRFQRIGSFLQTQSAAFRGKIFGIIMVTFCFTSSAGHLDDTAKLVKEMAKRDLRSRECMVNQVVDDGGGWG